MKQMELLAPAKDKETAIAAINYGCDAVYIGASAYGARQKASNSLEDLKEIVEYAHKFYVKVHVTINTILEDKELLLVEKLINNLYDIGVDAIIIQDMGILELAVNNKIPPIPIHISTQCDNRTLEKVQFFDKLGISRVILARELSLDKIQEITSSVNCEIETFIHGALCVSYSGQCYMSCANGGRSANKGECAQSCRKKYSLVDDKGKVLAKDMYLLSLKDFNASGSIKELVEANVKSFKIEGRLKDVNYVKNVTLYYRNLIDKIACKTSSGRIFSDFEPDLNKSFNRGFTDYFLNKRKECYNFRTPKSLGENLGKVTKVAKDYFEIDAELNPQDGLCYFINGTLEGCLVNKAVGKKVFLNKMPEIKVGTIVYRNFNSKFEKQLTNSKTKRQIGIKFSYNENILHAIDEDSNQVAMDVLHKEPPKNTEKMNETFINQLKKTGESDFYVEEVKIEKNVPFLPISEINALRREILEKLMVERLNNYDREVQQPLNYTNFPQKELSYSSNIHNAKANDFYMKCGTKVLEKSYESLPKKNIELMRTKHCLKFAFNMCNNPQKLFLIDEKRKKYELKFDCSNCEMIVIG